MASHDFHVESSHLLIDAPIIAVRQDVITTPTGRATREVVEHFSAVAIAPVRHGEVLLIRQYRHPIGEYLWEIPAGLLDVVGESPLDAARRELAEEVQLHATDWSVLGDIANTPGCSQEQCRIYRAEGLSTVANPVDAEDEEADVETLWLPISEAVEWVQTGRIINSVAVAAIFHLAAGTRRDVAEEFSYTSGLAQRRERERECGTDMKTVR